MKEIIVIIGPTGIGKTKLSIELAKKLDAEIINGDSVSIYRKLDIASAKPTKEEMNGVVHHLINIKDINEEYSVYDYQKDVRKLIEELNKKNKRIIIVGGTGFYIKAALYNYVFNTEKIANNYEELTIEEIINKIKEYNYDINNIDINNRRRLVRLLNKLDNNENISTDKDNLLYPVKFIGLTTERDILYEIINNRVDKMMDNGLLKEIISLKEYYKSSRILNSGIGYKEFYNYLYNNKNIDEVINDIKTNSRRFAKRQYTYFNNQFPVKWFNVDLNNFNNTINDVYEYIEKTS